MGHIGTFQTTFVIPNLTKETKRVPMTEAIYNAIKGKELAKEIAADPLVQNGVKLIPSVTRVSNKGLSMYVYLQAYEGAAPAASAAGSGRPSRAWRGTRDCGSSGSDGEAAHCVCDLLPERDEVYETQPQEVTPLPDTKLQLAPMNFTVDLSALAAGKYDCQVTVLNPSGGKGAFWQTPILLVQ